LTIDRISEIGSESPAGKNSKNKSPIRARKNKPPRSPEKIYSNVSNLDNSVYQRPKQITIERALRTFIFGFDKENKKYD